MAASRRSCLFQPRLPNHPIALGTQGVDSVAHPGQQVFREVIEIPDRWRIECPLLPADLNPHALYFSADMGELHGPTLLAP
jgi:hypothetical protein